MVRVHRGPPVTNLTRMEVRPSGGSSSSQLIGAALAWAILTLVALVWVPIALGQVGLIIDIPIAVVALLAGGLAVLYLRNQRLGFESGFLYRVNSFGLRRQWPASNLSEVVRARVLTGGGQMPTSIVDADLVVDRRGRAVASFTGVWPQEAMTELWRAAELPISTPWSEPVAVHTVRKQYPGAIPALPEYSDESSWWASPPFLAFAALLALAVLAVVGFFVAVIVAAEIEVLRSTH